MKKNIKCNFEKMICKSGSIIVFSNKCPHKSQKNNTDKDRGVYTTHTIQLNLVTIMINILLINLPLKILKAKLSGQK